MSDKGEEHEKAIDEERSAELDDNNLDPILEKKLVQKYDWFVMPVLGLLYFTSYLDRVNIGNANTAGMPKDLGLVGNQFGTAVSIVYATYIVFEPLFANLVKIITPKITFGILSLIWGALTVGTAFSKRYENLVAIRVLLGVFESGLTPSIWAYILMTYKRSEYALRMSYIFLASALTGAFGGLLAFGLTHIKESSLKGWQWLYIVEGVVFLSILLHGGIQLIGCLSFIASPIVFLALPNRADRAWFLNGEEKELAEKRVKANLAEYNPDEKFRWSAVWQAMTDWTTYSAGVIQYCNDVSLYGLATFMPSVITSMGFDSVNAQLLTVPVYVFGAISGIIQARLSDKYLARYPFIMAGFLLYVIGYAILVAAKPVGARYFALFVVVAGFYAVPGSNIAWTSGNNAGHFKRATAMGMNQLIGNAAGCSIGFVFDTRTAPRYTNGLYVAIGLSALGMLVATVQAIGLRLRNKEHRKLVDSGAMNDLSLGDHNPHFIYSL